MRVVLDTNILVRAVTGPNSPATQVLLRALGPPHVLLVSDFLLDELARVLRYDRLRRIHMLSDARLDAYVEHLRASAIRIDLPASPLNPVVLNDPSDDPVLATAIMGRAEVLCTLDRHFFESSVQAYCSQVGLRILTDTEFLAELRTSS